MSETEARVVASMAMGRIFRLLSRPEQDGDIEQYEAAKAAAEQAFAVLGFGAAPAPATHRPGWNFGGLTLD